MYADSSPKIKIEDISSVIQPLSPHAKLSAHTNLKRVILHETTKIMSKEKTPQKGDKKKAEKNLKEKRADKKAKKDSKTSV